MIKEGKFLVFCIERYNNAKHLTRKQVTMLFRKYRIPEYILSCFELYC
ncbi:DUF3791 domain-containing protein [Ructibacterium gallinarum]|uniref:DUF3791 domain-containing protein n=1 Tax=Ructibacterium gallinarum TaxID=2779355 RepID=A0A9D5M2U8_9FIRM|nr:DUF3791 domain-containing protein [Ructibacterium gallinarum]